MAEVHEVLKLWIRREKRGEMVRRDRLDLESGCGVREDHKYLAERHVTILFADDWAEAERDLGHAVDPATRRANVLVSGGGGFDLVEGSIKLGGALVEVMGIVAPCRRMEDAVAGLEEALKPGARAGIWGRVLGSGAVKTGDSLTRS